MSVPPVFLLRRLMLILLPVTAVGLDRELYEASEGGQKVLDIVERTKAYPEVAGELTI